MAESSGISSATTGFDSKKFSSAILRGDVALAVGIVAILMMLILPMPSWLLDIALAVSISFSIMVLMTALFIQKPLEFSAFPAVLLIATMLRLGLNLASTRLILSDGSQGPDAAGQIIRGFGALITQGNYVIGIIVFIILVIVNFVVITKGSGRIAEVAARFSLDAMPGKQMAIDADLSSGLLKEDEARQKRKDLEAESNFYGSMDGASKFVRGDAVAGLLITAINIIGGMIIGVGQEGMPFAQAASNYTMLTIGDGLVSQIPALVISIAAGLLVSKAGVEGAADKAIFAQFTGYPQGLIIVAGISLIAALMPGMPFVPFALMSVLLGGGAWLLHQRKAMEKTKADVATAEEAKESKNEEQPITESLHIDGLKIELGYNLLSLINDMEGRRLTDQIKALRRQMAQEMGFVMPPVRILDNMQLNADDYMVRVKEIEAGTGMLKLGHLLVMDPAGAQVDLPGDHVKEPTFGLPATWVTESLREEAMFKGLTVVDPATVLATHLTEILRDNMPDLLSFAETEKLLDGLGKEDKKLLEEISPSQISRSGIQQVLQGLLKERVSIRDLPAILEAIAEASATTQNLGAIIEHVRTRLARQLCHAAAAPDGTLPMLGLSPEWEQAFAENLIGEGDNRQLALPPSKLHEFINRVRDSFDAAAEAGDAPVLLTSPAIRPYVRSIIERFRGQTIVMSQNEIHPKARLKVVGQV
ncbi:MAG: flagellar biosynthesis protein FlhA [Robiginitomaculum sp.]|nr:flagellar biosynthesis protein FlhA [Robiginitomaculum sp.]MDQ7076552.1 flagellar biosynthesis protein FlhA [Robiginitomaculum sp.]